MSARLARAMEEGRLEGVVSRLVAAALAPVARRALVRPVSMRDPRVAIVGVGGATLGGSGKTPIALACARFLALRGAKVVLVGHGHRAVDRRARVVDADDRAAGDEALVSARALADLAPVVIGPSRQAAVDFALALAPRPDVLVLDGALRIQHAAGPALAVLAVDADHPWGSGAVFPGGDLRAPPATLLSTADHIAPTGFFNVGKEGLAALAGRSVGLFTALGRPQRLLRGLQQAGIVPRVHVAVNDHGPLTPAARSTLVDRTLPLDAWLATEKCASHLEGAALASPLIILEAPLPPLPQPLEAALAALVPHLPRPGIRERTPFLCGCPHGTP